MNSKAKSFSRSHHHHHRSHNKNEDQPIQEQKIPEQKILDEFSNKSLYISRIPIRSNSLIHLNNHYKRFGHINSIYTNKTNTWIIFETEEAAKAAYESPLTVLHNRFIHVSFQKPTIPNSANLSSVCNMEIVRNAVQAFIDESKTESEETEEIRNNLRKKKRLRKIEKAKSLVESYKEEQNKWIQETQQIVLDMDNLSNDEKEASKTRLASCLDMISIAQKKIDEIEKLLQGAGSIDENTNDETK